jgi:hypothetical protein
MNKSKGIGLEGTIKDIRSANGTAQYLLFAWWNIVFSGMLVGMHTNVYAIAAMGLLGAWVFYSTIYRCRVGIRRCILVTTFFNIIGLVNYMYGCKADHGAVFYDVRHTFYILAFVSLCSHGFYLAQLLTRQILEAKRILGDAPCR